MIAFKLRLDDFLYSCCFVVKVFKAIEKLRNFLKNASKRFGREKYLRPVAENSGEFCYLGN